MAFKFELGESFLTGIPRVAREQIAGVARLLSEKPQASPDSIHEARKCLKSVRAVLRLARGGIQDDCRDHENLFFREAGRSLSTARDLHAQLEALERVAKPGRRKSRLQTTDENTAHKLIQETRLEIEQQIKGQQIHEPIQILVKQLQNAKRRTAFWFQGILLQPGNEWETLIGAGLRQTYRKARNLVSQIEATGHKTADDEIWHDLRKNAKALGYQLRLLKPIWPATLGPLIDEIDELTSRLGDANDLAALQKRVREKRLLDHDLDDRTRNDLIHSIERRKQKLRLQAIKFGRIIYSERPGQFNRRLAGYWQIWRASRPLEKSMDSMRAEPLNETRGSSSKPEALAGCFA